MQSSSLELPINPFSGFSLLYRRTIWIFSVISGVCVSSPTTAKNWRPKTPFIQTLVSLVTTVQAPKRPVADLWCYICPEKRKYQSYTFEFIMKLCNFIIYEKHWAFAITKGSKEKELIGWLTLGEVVETEGWTEGPEVLLSYRTLITFTTTAAAISVSTTTTTTTTLDKSCH